MKANRIISLLLGLALVFGLLPTAVFAAAGETEVAITVKAGATTATVKPSDTMEVESVVWEGETVTVKVKIKDSKIFALFAAKASNINATINGSPAGVERVDDRHITVTYPKSAAPQLNENDYIVTFPGDQSGSKSLPKLSQVGIAALIDAAPGTLKEYPFEVEPSVKAPFAAGKVKESALQTATDRLTLMRRLAGLPGVVMDASLNQQAQHGAVLLVPTGRLNHFPPQPAGMSNDFYQKGYAATSSSNLWSTGIPGTIPAVRDYNLGLSPDAFMNDGGSGNEYAVGHRRWQLNPRLKKVGFGYATTISDNGYTLEYIDEKIFDSSGPAVDYDFISWPASGNFPNNLPAFGTSTEWSVTLNPSKYATPSASSVVVTVTRASDGKTWTFSKNSGHFAVNTASYGVANAIIFRPDGMNYTNYNGTYTVKIEGIKTSGGAATSLEYRIDFFNAKNPRDPSEEPGASSQPTTPTPAPEPTPTPEPAPTPEPTPTPAPEIPATGTAYPSTQTVDLDGKKVEFQMYALKDEAGNPTNYVKVRDLALALNGTKAQFSVEWDGAVNLAAGSAYTANGSENDTPFSGERAYTTPTSPTNVSGKASDLQAIMLTDDAGGGYTYYKLRDLGSKLGFNVSWSAERGVFIESDKPYSGQ